MVTSLPFDADLPLPWSLVKHWSFMARSRNCPYDVTGHVFLSHMSMYHLGWFRLGGCWTILSTPVSSWVMACAGVLLFLHAVRWCLEL